MPLSVGRNAFGTRYKPYFSAMTMGSRAEQRDHDQVPWFLI